MDAAVTRTRTSVGPTEGTGADSSDNPAPARILRKAFICPDLLTDISRVSQVQRTFWMVVQYTIVPLWRDPETRTGRAARGKRDKTLIFDYTLVSKNFQSDIGHAILSQL